MPEDKTEKKKENTKKEIKETVMKPLNETIPGAAYPTAKKDVTLAGVRPLAQPENPYPYYNRELSWVDFDARVLDEAYEAENPILERCRFLGITGSNLDEFFMVRVAGVQMQVEHKYNKRDASGLTPEQLYAQLSKKIHDFSEKQYSCLRHSILPTLKHEGIEFIRPSRMNEEQMKYIQTYYDKVLFPVLTPLAVDNSRPFPFLANKSLNICVRLKVDETTEDERKGKDKNKKRKEKEPQEAFAVVQVPGIMQRFVEVPGSAEHTYCLLEDIIICFMDKLFQGNEILCCSPFRMTRNSDLEIDEEAEDLLIEIRESIKKRKRGKPVRLELMSGCDSATLKFLTEQLDVRKEAIYMENGPLDLTLFSKFANIEGEDRLRYPKLTPVNPPAEFYGYTDIFQAIREKDRMVHHPYESFDSVVKFVQQAADDPDVLAIKETLYRVSGHSPIIAALIRAAENGKQVTVLVELKARFDEENNINWALKLEQAGCHVIYGLVGLKTHCKITLVVRREEDGIRRYLHMGTGNYNDSTAKLYTDIGLFTCREPFGVDASGLFNFLSGYSRPPVFSEMIVAPHDMRGAFENLILRETENAKKGLPSGITAKVNSLVDPDIINLLYDASRAGVKIRLIVRGICCLIPGLAGVSENITVISIVGQLLEHSRIFRFENGGSPRIFMGSADWMPRNLDRRVELVFPILDEDLKKRAFAILETMWSDNVNARQMMSNKEYVHIEHRGRPAVNSQQEFIRSAREEFEKLKAAEDASPAHPKETPRSADEDEI
ncbi:MAG: RNA degradosome polyphosphate kinase [Lachnospiraceae bacterium]|jgi:polyphosphate kinase